MIQLRPDSGEAHVELGKALLEAGRLAESQDIMSRAVRLAPDEIERAIDESTRTGQVH